MQLSRSNELTEIPEALYIPHEQFVSYLIPLKLVHLPGVRAITHESWTDKTIPLCYHGCQAVSLNKCGRINRSLTRNCFSPEQARLVEKKSLLCETHVSLGIACFSSVTRCLLTKTEFGHETTLSILYPIVSPGLSCSNVAEHHLVFSIV